MTLKVEALPQELLSRGLAFLATCDLSETVRADN